MSLFECAQCILFFGSALLAIILISLLIITKAITSPLPKIKRYKNEEDYLNPTTNTKEKFPSIDDEPSIDLSVIVPAYNEELRIKSMMIECLEYLDGRAKTEDFSYEVIIVSDGSTDNTVDVAHSFSKEYGTDKVRVLNLVRNRGKGGAVRLGILSSRGKYLLFADADGATKFSDFDKLETSMNTIAKDWKTSAIVIGSRAHLEDEAIATRSLFRIILMHGFHTLVWLFAVRGIRDTQCGFKLLTRSAARICFQVLHVEKWAFDVELLYIAQSKSMPINEICVNWTEIDGSKVTPLLSAIQMGKDLFFIWFRYTIGAWSMDVPSMSKDD